MLPNAWVGGVVAPVARAEAVDAPATDAARSAAAPSTDAMARWLMVVSPGARATDHRRPVHDRSVHTGCPGNRTSRTEGTLSNHPSPPREGGVDSLDGDGRARCAAGEAAHGGEATGIRRRRGRDRGQRARHVAAGVEVEGARD